MNNINLYIDEYIEKDIHKAFTINSLNNKLRTQFVEKFPKDNILNLSKFDYVTGNQNELSFCNFLETKLRSDGSIKGSFASGKFGFYYNKKEEKYIWLNKRWGNDEDIAFKSILTEIDKLLNFGFEQNLIEISKIKLSPMFKNKILYTYYPDKYLCVFSQEHIEHFLNKFQINYSKDLCVEEKRNLLLDFKSNNEKINGWSNYIFSHFLYTKLNPKSLEHIVNEKHIEECLNSDDDDINACYITELKLTKTRKTSQKNLKKLKKIYNGNCQLCGNNPVEEFNLDILECHHIDYFSKSQNNKLNNLILVCPNCHSLIHKTNPAFDFDSLTYQFKSGKIVTLKINKHLNYNE